MGLLLKFSHNRVCLVIMTEILMINYDGTLNKNNEI